MFRRFGSEVTIVEKGPRLILNEVEDISAAVKEILESEGINMRLGAECIAFEPGPNEISVHVSCESGEPRCLVPRLDGLD
jgi:pyruvate/2-oxoglutarate dehydrogenase complex dihydrolipoamide dehydrogenase (E3) component